MNEDKIIAGIDVGCSAVKCVVAVESEGGLEIAGVGITPCSGHVRQGVLVNAERAVQAVRAAVEEAESTCGLSVDRAFAAITGQHVRGILGSSTMEIGDGQSENPEKITIEDVREVTEAAGNINLPAGCRILERTVRDYAFEGFRDLPEPPVGLAATSLQARVYTVYADRISSENLITVLKGAGVEVEAMIPSAVASAEAVLNSDEKKVGTVVVDIGASNTDLVVYKGGSPVHLSSFPMGGNRITSDIQSLGISWEDAEKLKIERVAAGERYAEINSFSVRKVGGRGSITVGLPVLVQITSERLTEIFGFAVEEMNSFGIDASVLTGGIVITGGSARMAGIMELAAGLTGHQVEPGTPRGFSSDSTLAGMPEMSTAVGLVKRGAILRKGSGSARQPVRYRDFVSKVRDFFNKLK
jgi:cell division protein FtsA